MIIRKCTGYQSTISKQIVTLYTFMTTKTCFFKCSATEPSKAFPLVREKLVNDDNARVPRNN